MAQTTSARGRHIPALALTLFDQAAEAHGLPPRARLLLQLAAGCYAAAAQAGAERPDRVGRDLALAAPLGGTDSDDQAVVAGAVALQRSKVRPQREPALIHLDPKDQRLALRLAALLRLAEAIDTEAGGAPLVQVQGGATTVVLGGERAPEIAIGADERADLWRAAIGPLDVRIGTPDDAPAPALADAGDAQPAPELVARAAAVAQNISGGEPVSEGARRALRRFFDKLLAREDAVRKGEDPEDVHQMRVATRRLRAALQVLEGVYDSEMIRRYRRGLRRIAEPLGRVRDQDVFLAHVLAHREALPAEERAALDPLVAAIAAAREQARAALLAELGSRRYLRFQRRFAAFLTTPEVGALAPADHSPPPRVRDYAGSAIWRRYEQWRAYEVALADPSDELLHQARIAGKRLRYTLEFFADALGPSAEQALAPLGALQESLGHLQDGVVARAHVEALEMSGDPGAQAYLAAGDAERAQHLAEFPRLWEKVASATYRRRLSEMIVKL